MAKTNTEILNDLHSISSDEWVIEDKVGMEDFDTTAYKYKHCEGYFYDTNNNDYWIADPYDFETDEEGNISMPNAVWLKNR